MLSDKEMQMVLQTALFRLDNGLKGAPDSFTEEQKKAYEKTEAEIEKDRREGNIVSYSLPNNCDWDGFY